MDATTPTLIDWTTTRDDRQQLLACTICAAVDIDLCEPDRPTFCHIGRRWSVGITAPGMCMQRSATGGDLIARTNQCSPTIETINDGPGMSYRGACLGVDCEWVGPERSCENPAVEDAHDHSHPGWRQLPIVRPAAFDAKDKERDAWRREINRVYVGLGHPAHLTLPGGIIRTERKRLGTRSHWSHSVGGYDICGTVIDVDTSAPKPIAAAATLF